MQSPPSLLLPENFPSSKQDSQKRQGLIKRVQKVFFPCIFFTYKGSLSHWFIAGTSGGSKTYSWYGLKHVGFSRFESLVNIPSALVFIFPANWGVLEAWFWSTICFPQQDSFSYWSSIHSLDLNLFCRHWPFESYEPLSQPSWTLPSELFSLKGS